MSTSAISKTEFFAHQNALVESSDIGAGTRIWAFAHVMPGAHVGRDCNICDSAYIEGGATLGDNVTVKNGVAIWDRVTIERNVFLGPNMVFTNDFNPRSEIKKRRDGLLETFVREGATLGANATVVCGVEIGRYAFIGAGSVVIRNVPSYALMVGNPSRQIGWICECAHKLPLTVAAAKGQTATCNQCKRNYVVSESGAVRQTLGKG